VRHTNLQSVYTGESQPNEKFSGEECTIRVHVDVLQYVALEEFRRAVNVANTKPEPDAISNAVEGGVYETQWWIGTLQPISNNNRRSCLLRALNKAPKVGNAELTVAVGVGKVAVPRRGKT
jgi:hypothetical protein